MPAQGAPVTPFARDLVAAARGYLQTEAARRGVPLLTAAKATPARWLQLGVLAACYVATLPAFLRGELWTLFATSLCYWLLGVNVMHDGSHFALSRSWVVNALATYYGIYFSSPLEWYHQHVIGHHAYPNLPHRDPDLYHNGQMERHTRTLRWRPAHAHQHRTWVPIWWIGTAAMCFVKPVQMFLTGRYNRAVGVMALSRGRWLRHLLGRALVFFLCHGWPFVLLPASRACLFALVPPGLISLCFMASSQVNHLSDANVDQASADYYAQQVLTSHTFAVDSPLVTLFTGGLNFQIEHHLFPTINHCHLKALQPLVKEVCRKHGVPYHESPTMGAALRKYIQHLRTLGRKDAA